MKRIAFLATLSAFSTAGFAQTFTLGPNTYGDGALDTGGSGPRGNVEITGAMTLAAGTYTATNFTFSNLVANSDVQPFLSIVTAGTAGSGNETYQVIAAGVDNTGLAANAVGSSQTVAFGGSNTFTVPTGGETVYAGIDNVASDNGIPTDGGGVNGGPGPAEDSHFVPGPKGATVGTTLVDNAANPPYELNRNYDFAITVTSAVPEPSTWMAAGGLLLFAAGNFRRRQKA